MFCKHVVALLVWCHSYQLVLDPILQLATTGHGRSRWPPACAAASELSDDSMLGETNNVSLMPGQEIALRCNIAELPEAQFNWYRRKVYPYAMERPLGEENREELSGDERYSISNNVMIIKSSTLNDVADYYCKVRASPDQEVSEHEKMISVRPKPYIYEFELPASTSRSAVVEEGTALKISCNVADEYFPPERINISWRMSKYDENDMNEIHSGEDGISVQSINRTSSELHIDQVSRDHRRLYKCQASNGVTENSKTILIRVKNKYTVVWPAVGILFELVILIGVIVVVENRKVEPDRGAYDRKAIHQM